MQIQGKSLGEDTKYSIHNDERKDSQYLQCVYKPAFVQYPILGMTHNKSGIENVFLFRLNLHEAFQRVFVHLNQPLEKFACVHLANFQLFRSPY